MAANQLKVYTCEYFHQLKCSISVPSTAHAEHRFLSSLIQLSLHGMTKSTKSNDKVNKRLYHEVFDNTVHGHEKEFRFSRLIKQIFS